MVDALQEAHRILVDRGVVVDARPDSRDPARRTNSALYVSWARVYSRSTSPRYDARSARKVISLGRDAKSFEPRARTVNTIKAHGFRRKSSRSRSRTSPFSIAARRSAAR